MIIESKSIHATIKYIEQDGVAAHWRRGHDQYYTTIDIILQSIFDVMYSFCQECLL